MKAKWSKVPKFDPNSQDPDPPGMRQEDHGFRISGPGSMSGGSKPTPQTTRMKQGSAKLGNTAPKSPQRLRG